MAVRTSATSILRISAGVPATFDNAGYVALTFTTVGEITNFGEFGREWQVVNHNPVALRGTQKLKSTFDPGELTIQLGIDTDDAGQILVEAALASISLYAFVLVTPSLPATQADKYYFQGYVRSFRKNFSEGGTVTSAAAVIAVNTSITDVDYVVTLGT